VSRNSRFERERVSRNTFRRVQNSVRSGERRCSSQGLAPGFIFASQVEHIVMIDGVERLCEEAGQHQVDVDSVKRRSWGRRRLLASLLAALPDFGATALTLRFLEVCVFAVAGVVGLALASAIPLPTTVFIGAVDLVMLIEGAGREAASTVLTGLGLLGHGRTESQELNAQPRRWNQGDFRGSPEEDQRIRWKKKMGPAPAGPAIPLRTGPMESGAKSPRCPPPLRVAGLRPSGLRNAAT
jgi:hypothetical protein